MTVTIDSIEKALSDKSYLNLLGYEKLTYENIIDLQIDFLQKLCETWQYTIEKHNAIKDNKYDEIEKIVAAEKPILTLAHKIQYAIILLRLDMKMKIEKGLKRAKKEELQRDCKARCKQDFQFFINYWTLIHEPRMPSPVLKKFPFILYPAQAEALKAIERAYRTGTNLTICKSREAGISWGFCALVVWWWLHYPEFRAVLASETEEKVDVLGSSDPLFGKVRHILYNIPLWMRPRKFDNQEQNNYDNKRFIKNPDNDSEIKGEIGDSIGRSGRSSIVIIDECQDLLHPDKVNSSLESNYRSRIDVGTVRGMNHFYHLVHDGSRPVFRVHWKDDPRKNPDWKTGTMNYECAWRTYIGMKVDKVTIAQEYDMNFNASVENAFIPAEYVQAAIDFNIPPEGETVAGFDVAGSGKNESALCIRTGPVVREIKMMNYNTSTESAIEAIDYCTKIGVEYFVYDQDGIGNSLVGEFKTREIPVPFPVHGVANNGKASEEMIQDEGKRGYEKFRNKRAENWWNVLQRFEKTYRHRNEVQLYPSDELISIPNDPVLITQLSQPKRVWSGSKIGTESKKDMHTRGIDSPDKADALIFSFVRSDSMSGVIDEFDYTNQRPHIVSFECSDEEFYSPEKYVSIVHTDEMITNILCCMWAIRKGEKEHKLWIYSEISEKNATPEEMIFRVRSKMRETITPIKEWIANDEMFNDFELGKTNTRVNALESASRMYRKAGVPLKRNVYNDYNGSLMLINKMFEKNKIVIHSDCVNLCNQIRNWKLRKGKPNDSGLGLAMCLAQIVSRMKTRRYFDIPVSTERSYGRPVTKKAYV